jgi:hypothetical protein
MMDVPNDKVAEFRKLLGQDAGPLPTAMDEQLAGEDYEYGRGQFGQAHAHARLAHAKVAAMGAALAALEAWGRSLGFYPAAPATPATGLPPGMVVADVGTLPADQGAFDGNVNPALMSGPNWGYYAKANLGKSSGHIFDRPFVIGDPVAGTTFDEGTLAAFQNVADPLVRDAAGTVVFDLSKVGP